MQLSIFVCAGDRFAGRPLHCEIVDRARAAGLAGATAVRGMSGFGESGQLRSPGLAGLSGYEPVLIELTDEPVRVRAFLPVLDEIIGSGLVMVREIMVVRRRTSVTDVTASATS